MIFNINAKGHKNITSLHKSTFEITKDTEIGIAADCIIGVNMDKSMLNFPIEFKNKIIDSNSKILITLKTENAYDEIIGYGDEKLTLTHPTDIVIRKSEYICPRTLMIKANKAAKDLDLNLIEDLKNGKTMDVVIEILEK